MTPAPEASVIEEIVDLTDKYAFFAYSTGVTWFWAFVDKEKGTIMASSEAIFTSREKCGSRQFRLEEKNARNRLFD